jgi:hypothetical protein
MAILRDNWIVIAIGVVVIAALALLAWLWWQVPKWQMRGRIFRGEKERADAEDNFRKTVGQALGGAAVLIGAVVAYLQFTQQQQTSHNQLRAAHDLLISNQVAKGFEQLAGEKIAMRLGGIYGLEGVMNDPSQPYRVPVLEALCAFVREGTIGKKAGDQPATDIQAVLTVIGRRAEGWLDQMNLTSANIPKANLIQANLNGADLSGANLRGADLRGAKLLGAILDDAHLDSADLGPAREPHSPGSSFHLILTDLQDAFLRDADLSGANLLGANLNGARLDGLRLDGADLSGTEGLSQAQLNQACGTNAKLPPGLTLDKLCPPRPVAPPLNRDGTP